MNTAFLVAALLLSAEQPLAVSGSAAEKASDVAKRNNVAPKAAAAAPQKAVPFMAPAAPPAGAKAGVTTNLPTQANKFAAYRERQKMKRQAGYEAIYQQRLQAAKAAVDKQLAEAKDAAERKKAMDAFALEQQKALAWLQAQEALKPRYSYTPNLGTPGAASSSQSSVPRCPHCGMMCRRTGESTPYSEVWECPGGCGAVYANRQQ
jgi:hypothetical protein